MWTMKAAIFDMDGTVLDSMEQWRAQSVLLLERHGIELSDELSAWSPTGEPNFHVPERFGWVVFR